MQHPSDQMETLKEKSDFIIEERRVEKPVSRHAHDYLEFAYIVSGWTRHTLNGKTQRLSAGSYMILDYNETHSYDVVSEDLVVINCLFKPAFVDTALSGCRSFRELLSNYMINLSYIIDPNQNSEKICRDKNGEILLLFQKICAEFQAQKTGCMQLIRASLIEVIIKTMRQMEDRCLAVMQKQDETVMKIVQRINRSPNTVSSLSELAAETGLSVSSLSRKFRAATGCRFSDYLQKKRMELACRLLSNTNSKIFDIAAQSGYNDLKFFNAVFKNVVGETPTQYRKKFRAP